MTGTSKSRIISLLALILIFAMTVCAMSISVFAETVEHDHDGDGVADHTDEEHEEEEEKTLGDKISAWFKSDVGQIVGYCVAGVIFVAIVIFIILWIPKDNDKKTKTKKAKESK